MDATLARKIEFYREFLMVRGAALNPREYGVDMDRDEFVEKLVGEFEETYRGGLSIDELCLRPTEALRFCTDTRRRLGAFDLPDDIILRTIMNHRKRGGG